MAFRARGANVRRKQRAAVDSDNDDDVDEIAKKLAKARSAPKPAAPSTKPLVKLSVEDDDGEEIFKKKKKRPKARGVSTSALDDTDNGQNGKEGGAYSAAALSDLKSQTPQMPSGFADKNRKATGPAELRISGSFRSNVSAKSHESAMPETFKLPSKPHPDSFGIQPPSATPIPPPASGASGVAAADASGAAQNTSNRTAAGNNLEEEQSDDDDGDFSMPTAAFNQKAKEKRLRLRGAHMAPGYVPSDHLTFKPLKDYKKTEDAVKKGSDDDGSGEEQEEDMRLKFSGVAIKEKRRKHKPVVMPDQHDDEEGGSDSDGDQFAEAQVRRALGSAAAAPLAARRRDAGGAAGVLGKAAAAANIAGSGSAAARGAAALHSVQQLVGSMQERRDSARQGAYRTTAQVGASAADAVDADEKYREADDRYRFMQSLRAYIRDLCECLAHKIADVEVLEEERLAAMKELYADVRREREEVREELMVPAAAAVEALKRREDPDAAAQHAEAAAQQEAVPEQLDEFGRDENAVRRDRAATRATARTAAFAVMKERFQSAPTAALCDSEALAAAARGAAVGGEGGREADEERRAYYARRLGELQEVAEKKLYDVAPEFKSMQAVLGKIGEFKQRFPPQYMSAYMSESLPALVSVYVRLQLLSWDPLFQGGVDGAAQAAVTGQAFMEHAWFKQLMEFSSGEGDPDEDLVPAVVAQVLAKHSFSPMLQNAWDPCIHTASSSVRSTLDALLMFETPSTRDNLFALVDTVVNALARAADDATVPLWTPCTLLGAPVAAAAASVAWDNVVTLLAAVGSFQGFLSQELLAKVAGTQLLHTHVVPALDAYVKEAQLLLKGGGAASGVKGGSKRGITAHVPLALTFQKLLAVAAVLPKAWLQGGSSAGGEGAKAVLPLKQVARNAVRLVGGQGGLRGVNIEEDAERVRQSLSL